MGESGEGNFSRRDILKGLGATAASALVGTKAEALSGGDKEKIRNEMHDVLERSVTFFKKITSLKSPEDGFLQIRTDVSAILENFCSHAEDAMQGNPAVIGSSEEYSRLAYIFSGDEVYSIRSKIDQEIEHIEQLVRLASDSVMIPESLQKEKADLAAYLESERATLKRL